VKRIAASARLPQGCAAPGAFVGGPASGRFARSGPHDIA